MSSNQLKRVNYSIYLDPVNSNADRYAVGVMQGWAKDRKEMMSDPSAGVALHYSLHMHKNIYLAGMFLYLLSPALSNALAGSLTEERIKIDTLEQQLENCGLALPSTKSSLPAFDTHALIDELKAAVNMKPLMDEIQQLKAGLIESNTETAAVQNGLSESDIATLQQNLAAEIKAHSQHREIAELKALLKTQNQLIKSLSNGQPLPEIEKSEPELDLSEQIASIQKVKKKGIF